MILMVFGSQLHFGLWPVYRSHYSTNYSGLADATYTVQLGATSYFNATDLDFGVRAAALFEQKHHQPAG